LSICVLVAYEIAVGTFFDGSSLDFQQLLKVAEQTHLLGVVLRVVLDVLLMRLEVLHDVFLLAQLCVEELGIGLELVGESLVRLVEELSFVADSLQEGVINLSLNIVLMVFFLVFDVVVEDLFHVTIHLALFLIKLVDNVIVSFLFLNVDSFDILHFLTKRTQFLNLGSEVLLSVFNFLFNLSHSLRNFLQRLIFLIVKKLLLIGNTLNLIFNV